MEYKLSKKYSSPELQSMIMGPNPVKLEEELLSGANIKAGETICDLGSGNGLTSVFLAKEYCAKVYAADLWSNPDENMKFFVSQGLTKENIVPVKVDANKLEFEKEFFDKIVSIDSYNYFGRDENYLDNKLLPYLKNGGYVYIAIAGMKKDCHENLPQELLLSWTPEQLEYMHDVQWWKNIVSKSKDCDIVEIKEMESNAEVWNDWLAQENEYAINDRKSMNAGAGKYLNFISIVLKKKSKTKICLER